VGEGFFGERVAARYDERSQAMYEPAVLGPTVDFLAELAGDGDALEFGIGTGRVALPLAERGIRVAGIDSSEPMLERLRAKPGADAIEAVTGDFATTRVPGEFSLVFLVFHTINNLTSQDAQLACFENAAAHLRGGGRFVIETGVPPLRRLPHGQTVLPIRAETEGFSLSAFDVVTQRYSNHHFYVSGGQQESFTVEFRYAWPAELDLMARIAGLRLHARWAGWEREPFTDMSLSHVTVYEKP
jgi:SAM-dependent methyltransferase